MAPELDDLGDARLRQQLLEQGAGLEAEPGVDDRRRSRGRRGDQGEDRAVAGAPEHAVERPVDATPAAPISARNGSLTVSRAKTGQPVAADEAAGDRALAARRHAVDHDEAPPRPPGQRGERRPDDAGVVAELGRDDGGAIPARLGGQQRHGRRRLAPESAAEDDALAVERSPPARRPPAAAGAAQAARTPRATPSPTRARSSSAAAVVPSGKPGGADQAAEGGARAHRLDAAATAAEAGRAGRDRPGCGRAGRRLARPRTMRPSSIRPPPMPVPMVSSARWRAPRPAPSRASATSAMLASLSMTTGRAKRSSIASASGDRRQVDDSRRRAPRAGRSRPARARRCRWPRRRGVDLGDERDQPRQHLARDRGRWPARARARMAPSAATRAGAQVGAADVDADGDGLCARVSAGRGARQRRGHGVRPRPWPGACAITAWISRSRGTAIGLEPLAGHGAVERDAVLPQRAPGDDARGAVRHRGLDLAEEGLVVDARRQHRPGHVAREPGDRGAGLGRARDTESSAPWPRARGRAASRPRSARRSWPHRLPCSRPRAGRSRNSTTSSRSSRAKSATTASRVARFGLVRRRHVGAQVDHDLAAGAAELAHAAGGDALDHVRDAVALRRDVPAGGVDADEQRGRRGRASPSSTSCGTAQIGSTSTQPAWKARYRVMSALVSPSMALVIAFCAAGSEASACACRRAGRRRSPSSRRRRRRSAGSPAARPWSSCVIACPPCRPPHPKAIAKAGPVRVNVLRRRCVAYC